MSLRANIHWKNVVKQFLVINPTASNLRCERRCSPGIHHVWFTHESTSNSTLCFGKASRNIGTWVDWKLRFAWNDWVIEVWFACSSEWIPQRNGNSEVTLTTDEPVTIESTNPVGVSVLHEVGVPCEFIASLQQCSTQHFIATTVTDVPLSTGHDFERSVTLFEELHWMSNGFWFAIHVAT